MHNTGFSSKNKCPFEIAFERFKIDFEKLKQIVEYGKFFKNCFWPNHLYYSRF